MVVNLSYSTTVDMSSVQLQFPPLRVLFTGVFNIGGEQRERRVCTSPACIKAAARMLARLDPSVDPCSDFYQFSCGRFLETGNVPDDSSQLSTLQEMQDEMFQITRSLLRFYFDVCLLNAFSFEKKSIILQCLEEFS